MERPGRPPAGKVRLTSVCRGHVLRSSGEDGGGSRVGTDCKRSKHPGRGFGIGLSTLKCVAAWLSRSRGLGPAAGSGKEVWRQDGSPEALA